MPAKTVEQPTTKPGQAAPTPDPLTALARRIEALEERVRAVEACAHSAHAIGPDTVTHIASAAVAQVQSEVLTQLGISGFPSRGDA